MSESDSRVSWFYVAYVTVWMLVLAAAFAIGTLRGVGVIPVKPCECEKCKKHASESSDSD